MELTIFIFPRSQEYSDQLSIRDTTISALEKEVQKLKDVTAANKSGNVASNKGRTAQAPPHAKNAQKPVAGPAFNRTWSLRISKKDRNEMNDKIAAASCGVRQPKAPTTGQRADAATLPRSKRTDKQPTTAALPRKAAKGAAPTRTDARTVKVKTSAKSGVVKKTTAGSTTTAATTQSGAKLRRENSHDASTATDDGDSVNSKYSGKYRMLFDEVYLLCPFISWLKLPQGDFA